MGHPLISITFVHDPSMSTMPFRLPQFPYLDMMDWMSILNQWLLVSSLLGILLGCKKLKKLIVVYRIFALITLGICIYLIYCSFSENLEVEYPEMEYEAKANISPLISIHIFIQTLVVLGSFFERADNSKWKWICLEGNFVELPGIYSRNKLWILVYGDKDVTIRYG